MKVWDRKNKRFTKTRTDAEGMIKFLNSPGAGNFLNNIFFSRKIFSSIMGFLADTSFSRRFIGGFSKKHGINSEESLKKPHEFKTFNDFFTRKLKDGSRQYLHYGRKVPLKMPEDILISPADGAVTVKYVSSCEKTVVKGRTYEMKDLMMGEEFDILYNIRLSPEDYHRFHYPLSGLKGETRRIRGFYNTVNPIGVKFRPETYFVNKKDYFFMESEKMGKILFIAVGASGVGKMVHKDLKKTYVTGGDEAGYFKFGGSTVLLFASSDYISPSHDLLEMTKMGYETKVLMGETIGMKKEGVKSIPSL